MILTSPHLSSLRAPCLELSAFLAVSKSASTNLRLLASLVLSECHISRPLRSRRWKRKEVRVDLMELGWCMDGQLEQHSVGRHFSKKGG